MRRIALPALTVFAVALIPASSAFAIGSTQKFAASVTPAKAGTKKKPTNVALKVRPFFDDISADSANPFATKFANVFFDKNLVFNGRFFPSCAPAKVLSNASSCPRGSKVGTGVASGTALGLTENLTVGIFNGPGGNKVELLVDGSTPLTIHAVIEGTLTKQTGKYGYLLKVPVPADLQQPAPGAVATLTNFNTTVKGQITRKRKKIPFIGLAGCTAGNLAFGYTGEFTDDTSQTVEVTQACR